jgi:hypothetical protein
VEEVPFDRHSEGSGESVRALDPGKEEFLGKMSWFGMTAIFSFSADPEACSTKGDAMR